MNLKNMSVAGTFYDSNSEQLAETLDRYSKSSVIACDYTSRAIIVPHAGYIYSGQLANDGFQYLDKDLKTLIIFAPCHKVPVNTFALSSYDAFDTPFGSVYTHNDLTKQIAEMGGEINDTAFENEHSIEVQLPFIKKYTNANIVPILIGNIDFHLISDIISKYWADKSIGFVISSDLSHYLNQNDANKLDVATAFAIENNGFMSIDSQQACNCSAINGLLHFAKNNNFSMIRVGLIDSSSTTGDKTSVVGYGSWFLSEIPKGKFIIKYFSTGLINIAKCSIISAIKNTNVEIDYYPNALETKMASFVTLGMDNALRGCVGSISPIDPLLIDVCKNARNAAFNDPRFRPVSLQEFEKLKFAVSILSFPEKIEFKDENDLLEQLRPKIDGLIIKDNNKQAVYLPSVWEELSVKRIFLNSLKQKAGLPIDWFSPTFEAFRFTTDTVDEL